MLNISKELKCPKFKSTKIETPNFLLKLYHILEGPENEDVIHWDHTGQYIVMKNLKVFTEKILPVYYKHKNYSSFVRQLNMYDFHKKRNSDNEEMFYHNLFSKMHKNVITSIKRKTRKRREAFSINQNTPSSKWGNNDINDKKTTKASIETTISALAQKMKKNKERQQLFENKIDSLSNDNEDNLHKNRQIIKDFISKTEYKTKLEAIVMFIIEVLLQKPHVKTTSINDTKQRKNSDIVSSALMKEMMMTDSSMYSTLLNFKHNNLEIFNQLISKNNRANSNDYLLLSPQPKNKVSPTQLFTCSPLNSRVITEDSLLSSGDELSVNKVYTMNNLSRLSTMNHNNFFDSNNTNINRIGEDCSNISINSRNLFDCDYDDVIINSILSDPHLLMTKKNQD